MTFQWPWMLGCLLAVPLLVVAYRRLLRQRAARRSQLAALGLVAPAALWSGRRRHVVPVLFLAAFTLLLLALARPVASIAQPQRQGTVVLAFDSSASMAATDLAPTRMEAAKAAARAFLESQPPTIRVGVVTFGESALIMQPPTTDRTKVLAAIARLTPQGATSLGRGLQTALSAIAGKTVPLDAPAGSGGVEAQGGDIGYYGSAAVILLSDGENTTAPDPVQVAALASVAGVKVYPIGLGSAAGTVLQLDGFQLATALDEPLLRQIAATTDGSYFNAADSAALKRVYQSIDLAWTVTAERTEVTALLAGAAALLLVVAAGLSLARSGRVI